MNYSDELIALPRRARNHKPDETQLEELHDEPLKIKQSKYDHLQALKSVMAADYHQFYNRIHHC